jgi:hypothetical protein
LFSVRMCWCLPSRFPCRVAFVSTVPWVPSCAPVCLPGAGRPTHAVLISCTHVLVSSSSLTFLFTVAHTCSVFSSTMSFMNVRPRGGLSFVPSPVPHAHAGVDLFVHHLAHRSGKGHLHGHQRGHLHEQQLRCREVPCRGAGYATVGLCTCGAGPRDGNGCATVNSTGNTSNNCPG